MWTSTGRSGYGDTNLNGTYDDAILGLSPNGRQYRNESTLETRNLSGHAYWSFRKQITPKQEIPEDLYARNETESMAHTLANGQANLAKYADPVAPKKVSSIDLADRILPQKKRYNVLTEQMTQLVAEYKAGKRSLQEYSQLLDILTCKRDRAEILLKKALSQKPIREDDTQPTKQAPINIHPKHTDTQESVANHPTLNAVKQKISSAMLEAKVFWGMSAVVCVGMMLMSQ